MKQYFFNKLIHPRPSFAQDMSDDEKALIQEHASYLAGLAEQGVAIVFGPVLDPKGSYGIVIVEVESEDDVKTLTANDPVIKSGRGFRYETYSMPRIGFRKCQENGGN